MPRLPRNLILEDKSFFHVTWKCHNEDFLLQDERAKTHLYDLLRRFKEKYHIKIYGYCFMDNHPHIVGYCESVKEFSRYFQVVNGMFARFINTQMERKGQVIMDRLRSPQIQTERYLLTVLRYVDLNPVRAGICKNAKDYRWSSHRSYAHGKKDPLLDPLPSGLSITEHQYQMLHSFTLEKHRQKIPVYYRTYFIGAPSWVRKRRKTLFQTLSAKKIIPPNIVTPALLQNPKSKITQTKK
ncbi:MAG: transposase [Deltaproteobacteria bacterium]|nr:transposase [Deltaproteobacteria bacterium]